MAINSINGGSNTGLFQLHKAQSDQQKSMLRIATGMRLLSAADDAAGMAIGNEMSADLRSMTQAARNANDGISLTQTADGAMGEIGNMLGRMRELSVQASNGTLNDSQRSIIDKEYQQLKQEIDRVSETTEFNGIKLLDGSESSIDIQVGTDPGAEGQVGIELGATTSAGLGVDGSSVSSASSAAAGMSAIDDAISSLSRRRVDLGAAQNRLGSTLSNLGQRQVDTEAARSRIVDADMAGEVSNMIASQIRQQASIAMQAHQNQSASHALALLG